MKTIPFKTIIPFMVFMLAIAFAFATDNNTTNSDNAAITGYIMQSGLCVPATKECNQVNLYPCKYQGQQVYQVREGATSCSIPLFHSQEN